MYVLIFNGLKERMMKTKEEILNEFGCPDIPFDENVTMYYPAILSAMEEYAQQQLKILNIPAVSGSSLPLKIERIIAVVAQRWGKDYGGSTVGMLGKDAIELCEQYGIDLENYS